MEGAKDNKLLSMHRLSPTPFSSDEGAESGDDSEEDIVTNYLAGSPAGGVTREGPSTTIPTNTTPTTTTTSNNPLHHHHYHHHHGHRMMQKQQKVTQQGSGRPLSNQGAARTMQQPTVPQVAASVQPAHAHGPPRRLVRMAEIPTMDSITAESYGMGVGVPPPDAFIPSIPTISITPHSPIAHKPFTVLDENIRQLQGIQDSIQRMRETSLVVKSGRGLSRLSTSCPSLNVDGEELEDDDSPTCSEEFLDARKSRGGATTAISDCHRRRSWSGLSDEEKKRARHRRVYQELQRQIHTTLPPLSQDVSSPPSSPPLLASPSPPLEHYHPLQNSPTSSSPSTLLEDASPTPTSPPTSSPPLLPPLLSSPPPATRFPYLTTSLYYHVPPLPSPQDEPSPPSSPPYPIPISQPPAPLRFSFKRPPQLPPLLPLSKPPTPCSQTPPPLRLPPLPPGHHPLPLSPFLPASPPWLSSQTSRNAHNLPLSATSFRPMLPLRSKPPLPPRPWHKGTQASQLPPSTARTHTAISSISLSSLDSEAEEAFYDAEESGNTQGSDSVDGGCRRGVEKQRSMSGSSSPVTYGGGGSSTHSLNDVHLQTCVKHEKRASGPIEKPRLLAPRLTLQKSVSTPSILAGVATQPPQQQPQSNYRYEDDTSNKPRKRSSIFFRKKKDKAAEKLKKSSHQFVSVCYSNSATCDVCSKPMTNKPALRCEICQVCVHEHSCKDQISDCSKLKNPKHIQLAAGLTTLVIQKPSGSIGLSSATKSASLGSYVGGPGGAPTSGPGSKNQQAAVARSRSAAAHSSSPTRPTSVSSPSGCVAWPPRPANTPARPNSGCVSSPVRRLSGFSQWKRVANKLGVNSKVQSEEKEAELLPHDAAAGDVNILEVNSASMESLDDGGTEEPSLDHIDADPELRLLEEPETWLNTVNREISDRLTDKQVKKQESIHELINTERSHCLMLKVMQKVFAEGMLRDLNMQESRVKRIFPCLDELITLHCSFLWRLRQRQRENMYIDSIGDLLLDQFMGDNAKGLKDAYGVFCSQHQDAVSFYKDMLRTDRRFQNFVRQKSSHPLTKKKGIPECILFVTHRVTKYPLMLEALMKYSKDQEDELVTLKKALGLVKEILVNINAQVAEKEREIRLFDMYNKIDAKSSAIYNDQKFKKSDFFSRSRKLKFEGSAYLLPQKGKSTPVQVVVLSDLVFFLLDNNGKYYFYSPDSKQAGVIPLRNILVRERAGEGSKSFFLVHDKNSAEMIVYKNMPGEIFELECVHPKDRRIWLESIREAIEQCPDESELGDSSSENSKVQEVQNEKIRELIGLLQVKDKDVARACEEKMGVVCELTELLGQEDAPPSPQYRALLDDNHLDPTAARGLQISSLMEALRLVSGACGWGTNLARSVSSVGEHQSEAYVSPSLPKRAETFGGFDNSNKDAAGHSKQSAGKKKKDSRLSLTSTGTSESSEILESLKNRRPSGSTLTVRTSQDNISMVSTLSGDSTATQQQQQQQDVASRIIHALNTSLVLSQHHLTQYDILRSKLVVGTGTVEGRFRHSQKLEELRNIQEHISHERALWNKEKDSQEKWISDKKVEIQKKQEQLRREEQDITQQRETLYRKMEALKAIKGISLGPNLAVYTSPPPGMAHTEDAHGGSMGVSEGGQVVTQGSPHSSPTTSAAPPTTQARSDHKHRNSSASLTSIIKRDSSQSLPIHLISATTQAKGSAPSVKQQLPMKLAKLGSSSSTGSSQGSMGGASSPGQDHHRPHHSPGGTPGGGGIVQQMLPLKLSQGPGDTKGSRMTVGYQRLASSPPSLQEPPPGHSHQRTGSSPATLQNGSPATSPGMASASIAGGQGTRATRTNTYPKLPSKPSTPGSRSGDSITPEGLHEGAASSGARPGQRIKDPDTNQDIIFF